MSAPETIGHPSHASENPRRSRLLWSHLEKVRSFRMNPYSEGSPRIRAHPLAGSDAGNRVSACIRTIANRNPNWTAGRPGCTSEHGGPGSRIIALGGDRL